MQLDLVHDMQCAYRKVLDSMSRPGLISDLSREAEKIDLETGCFKATLALLLVFMDVQTSFKAFGGRAEEFTSQINRLTYARSSGLENADFVIILNDAGTDELEIAMGAIRAGSLLKPHTGATLIMEASSISNEPCLILTGPGIAVAQYARIDRTGEWVEARTARNAEYPIGIDMIFVDRNNRLMCLPRTTQINRRGD